MRLLITGGAGYVGREFIRQFMVVDELCVIDSQRYGYSRFSDDELAKITLHIEDINNTQKVKEIIENFKPEAIVHLAAVHFIPECENNPTLAYDVNITGLISMLDSCQEGTRFVFASSAAVYAPDSEGHREHESKIMPMDIYGFSKLHGEDMVKYYTRKKNLNSTIVRLFNVVGPGETNPHLLPEIFAQFKSGLKQISLGNLEPKRDYINVSDAANGFHTFAVNTTGKLGEYDTVNLGTGNQYSVNEILQKIRDISDYEFKVYQEPARMRASDRPFLCANVGRLNENYSFIAKKNIDDTIQEMLGRPEMAPFLIEKYKL